MFNANRIYRYKAFKVETPGDKSMEFTKTRGPNAPWVALRKMANVNTFWHLSFSPMSRGGSFVYRLMCITSCVFFWTTFDAGSILHLAHSLGHYWNAQSVDFPDARLVDEILQADTVYLSTLPCCLFISNSEGVIYHFLLIIP